jgi:hypothetical protein
MAVSAQSIGQVRLLRHRLATAGALLTAAADGIPNVVLERASFRSHKLAAPDWARIMSAMPPPYRRDGAVRLAQWRALRPVGRLIEDGDTLGGDVSVVVRSLVVGRIHGAAQRVEDVWGLAFADHALCRVLERSGYTADPEAAMLDAHAAVLAASGDLAGVLVSEQRWAIPGGPGAFLATLRQADDGGPPLVALTAETWVSSDQLRPDQEVQVAAIRFRQVGPTLGEGLFRPAAMAGSVPHPATAGRLAALLSDDPS